MEDPFVAVKYRGSGTRSSIIWKRSATSRAVKDGWVFRLRVRFQARPDGNTALQSAYSIPLKSVPRTLGEQEYYKLLKEGHLSMIAGKATDGELMDPAFHVLKDDKQGFPPAQVCLLTRSDVLQDHPELTGMVEGSGYEAEYRLTTKAELRNGCEAPSCKGHCRRFSGRQDPVVPPYRYRSSPDLAPSSGRLSFCPKPGHILLEATLTCSLRRNPLVRVEQVRKSYWLDHNPVIALDAASLQIQSGEFLAITGPSGSGKSTLLNLIGCLDQPSAGRILIDGIDTSTLSPKEAAALRREKIGFVFQNFNLIPVLTAWENVEYPLLIQRVSERERKRRITEALHSVGLQDRAGHRPDLLSGGERQRVAVARAIVHRPALVLADEPTANLDTRNATQLIDLMRDLNRQIGRDVSVFHPRPAAARPCRPDCAAL